jgi:hypothetical protein
VPTYERRHGDLVAERIRVPAGGDEDGKYSALVAAGVGNWACVDEPKRPRATGRKQTVRKTN